MYLPPAATLFMRALDDLGPDDADRIARAKPRPLATEWVDRTHAETRRAGSWPTATRCSRRTSVIAVVVVALLAQRQRGALGAGEEAVHALAEAGELEAPLEP